MRSSRRPNVAVAMALAVAASTSLCACRSGSPAPPGCDAGRRACAADAGDFVLHLELGPRPIRPLSELQAAVTISTGGRPVDGAEVSLALTMPGMYMGNNRAPLKGLGGGRYAGQATLVRCPSGRRGWVAEVTAELPSGRRSASFPFEVSE